MARKAAAALLKQGVRKMAASERKNLEAELAQIIGDLDSKGGQDGDEARPDLLQEKFRLTARRKQIEDMLNKDDDLCAADGGDRDRLESRIKDLETRIKNGLPTARESAYMPRNAQDFEIAVKKTMAHQKAHLKDIQEWQQLKRRQEPENPMSDDVSLLLK